MYCCKAFAQGDPDERAVLRSVGALVALFRSVRNEPSLEPLVKKAIGDPSFLTGLSVLLEEQLSYA